MDSRIPLNIILLFSLASEVYTLVMLELPESCKSDGKDAYFVGVNYARVVIRSDGRPYSTNINCKLHLIERGTNATVDLRWMQFDMEPPDAHGACRDYVQVFRLEPSTNAVQQVTGRVCGSTKPSDSVEQVNEVIVHVKTSDIPSTRKGFVLEYKKLAGGLLPTSSPSESLDDGLIAAAVIGGLILIVFVVLLVVCLYCVIHHHGDLMNYRHQNDSGEEKATPHRITHAIYGQNWTAPGVARKH